MKQKNEATADALSERASVSGCIVFCSIFIDFILRRLISLLAAAPVLVYP